MSKTNDERHRRLVSKRKRRDKRKAARATKTYKKPAVAVNSVATFSKSAWKNPASNNTNVLKSMSKSNIKFNRDAWQNPDPANRPTVTEPHTGDNSQEAK